MSDCNCPNPCSTTYYTFDFSYVALSSLSVYRSISSNINSLQQHYRRALELKHVSFLHIYYAFNLKWSWKQTTIQTFSAKHSLWGWHWVFRGIMHNWCDKNLRIYALDNEFDILVVFRTYPISDPVWLEQNETGFRNRIWIRENMKPLQVLCSLSGRTSYRKISWIIEAARLGVMMIVSLWHLTDI